MSSAHEPASGFLVEGNAPDPEEPSRQARLLLISGPSSGADWAAVMQEEFDREGVAKSGDDAGGARTPDYGGSGSVSRGAMVVLPMAESPNKKKPAFMPAMKRGMVSVSPAAVELSMEDARKNMYSAKPLALSQYARQYGNYSSGWSLEWCEYELDPVERKYEYWIREKHRTGPSKRQRDIRLEDWDVLRAAFALAMSGAGDRNIDDNSDRTPGMALIKVRDKEAVSFLQVNEEDEKVRKLHRVLERMIKG